MASEIRETVGTFEADARQRVMELLATCLLDSGAAPWFCGLLATLLHVDEGFWSPSRRLIAALATHAERLLNDDCTKNIQVLEPLVFVLWRSREPLAERFLQPFVLDRDVRKRDYIRVVDYAGGRRGLLRMLHHHIIRREHPLERASELGRLVEVSAHVGEWGEPTAESIASIARPILDGCAAVFSKDLAARSAQLLPPAVRDLL
ncbi:MAG TPA: hypothetical protein VHB79_19005 [Polyangiaceae bacterium]|nr:hypothetical protein [Polyangiaceae bacterium]